MSDTYQAIYEHGVLRPLQPLPLNEGDGVSIAIVLPSKSSQQSDEQLGLKQRDILLAFIEKMKTLPDNSPQDGLSNRDHDQIIYGR